MVNGFKDEPFHFIVCPIPGWQHTTVVHHVYSHMYVPYTHMKTHVTYMPKSIYMAIVTLNM